MDRFWIFVTTHVGIDKKIALDFGLGFALTPKQYEFYILVAKTSQTGTEERDK